MGLALVAQRLRLRSDSSLGVFQSPPLHRHLHRASTPELTSFEGDLPFGSDLPGSELVPPLPFLPASTVCSARRPAGLLRPAAGHGVRHISWWRQDCSRGKHQRRRAAVFPPRQLALITIPKDRTTASDSPIHAIGPPGRRRGRRERANPLLQPPPAPAPAMRPPMSPSTSPVEVSPPRAGVQALGKVANA
jgi:hypothetical protein